METGSATEADVERYTTGECHVFALALHELTGWKILAVLDEGERHWENPDDDDNYIPAVCHIFCVDENNIAWDVRGRRPLDDVRNEMEEWLHIQDYSCDILTSSDALVELYVDDVNDIEVDRPLAPYTYSDVVDAKSVAQEILDQLSIIPMALK